MNDWKHGLGKTHKGWVWHVGVFSELWHGDPCIDPMAGRHGSGEACKSDEGQECALHGWRVTCDDWSR